ncbi:HEPN domain-containing protein [Ruminococcus sp. CLA-AA-H200]|uniref:HEPN domain-containing protein n=1 Tax=Ruminococcus turbiniformis TaxID=2881258 RepID=A0ABS8FZU9_9FIRM|nr:HEPN domain-containing protein [Ruminococcus turbiniformis]MCC2255560.1 HEPN domain-containing protein [Ruminococcus turbiniformis]
MGLNNYYDFAENDYQFFNQSYTMGIKAPAQAALGQSICERYLKHIISEYANPETDSEFYKKESVLRTHSLHKLTTYLQDDMGIEIPDRILDELGRIDGFYFTTRYPGDDSFIATERDIDTARSAVEYARTFTLGIIRQMEHEEPSASEDEPEL